jgi:hypothetical protein
MDFRDLNKGSPKSDLNKDKCFGWQWCI